MLIQTHFSDPVFRFSTHKCFKENKKNNQTLISFFRIGNRMRYGYEDEGSTRSPQEAVGFGKTLASKKNLLVKDFMFVGAILQRKRRSSLERQLYSVLLMESMCDLHC